MADTKISAMTLATTVADADIAPIVQGGANKRSPFSVVWTYIKSKIDTVFVPSPVTLSISTGLVAVNAAAGSFFDLTLTSDATISNPTNPVDCKVLKFRIRQDGTGGWVPSLGTKFRIPSSATTPLAWSTAASTMDIFTVIYTAVDDRWEVVSLIPGYQP